MNREEVARGLLVKLFETVAYRSGPGSRVVTDYEGFQDADLTEVEVAYLDAVLPPQPNVRSKRHPI
jgi:hypothetical protein